MAGLFLSTTFAAFSLRGPKIAPPPAPTPSPNPNTSSGDEFEVVPSPEPSPYPPASPSHDGGASFAGSRTPSLHPSSAFARTVEVLHSIPSLDSSRDASSANGRSVRDWATARSASVNEMEMEEASGASLSFVQPSPQPSPQARWVPSEWAARREKWGRSEVFEEEGEEGLADTR